MKTPLLLAIAGLCCLALADAETRIFANNAGKEIEAELLGVQDGKAVLKLAGGRKANVPISSLSKQDQTYIKAWYEENKNKISESDVRLTIDKHSKRIRMPEPKNQGKNKGKSKKSKDETYYSLKLDNYSPKSVEGITASYIIYKRVSSRGENGSDTSMEEIAGTVNVDNLTPNGSVEFKTSVEVCEDSTEKPQKGPSSTHRETISGIVVTLTVGEEEFLKQSLPENLIDHLEEERKRQEALDKQRE